MDAIEILGIVAGVLTTFAFAPQAVKTWKTGSARDFSLPTLLMLVSGVALWTLYGVLRGAPAVWRSRCPRRGDQVTAAFRPARRLTLRRAASAPRPSRLPFHRQRPRPFQCPCR